jgi:hypothetical protein
MGWLEVFVEVNTWEVPAVASACRRSPADAGSAECGINDEKLDEVPAEAVDRLDDDTTGYGFAGDVDLAVSGHQAAPQELSPLGVALNRYVIGAQKAVQVIGNCAADPSQRLRHRPYLLPPISARARPEGYGGERALNPKGPQGEDSHE